jgi:hypothetical protein
MAAELPLPLTAYPAASGGIWEVLVARVRHEPFNALALSIFVLAILHTFAAARFARLAHRVQERHDARARADGRAASPSVAAELLHFLGEIEVVFGLWAVVLMGAMTVYAGWDTAKHYVNDSVNYTEPLFVVVIMTLASTRPVISAAERALRRVARLGGATPAAWWITILTLGPMLGSFVTEPAAMTICALLLARQFYDLEPSVRLRYATLGLLFVNVSIGGTLTPFAAPPVLMVARQWGWDIPFMATHFGWRAALSIAASTALYYLIFRRELRALASHPAVADVDVPEAQTDLPTTMLPVPVWITVTHLAFMAWTVFTAHYPALFLGGFLFFLGFARATVVYQSRIDLKTPLLVGFFLAGLVIHGGLQGWWIAPVLASLAEEQLFLASAALTAFNDNALITYLATLVPNLEAELRLAVVQGAVVGGGLTVIANAPNPAGQALLSKFFGDAVLPLGLVVSAACPTIVTALIFRLTQG